MPSPETHRAVPPSACSVAAGCVFAGALCAAAFAAVRIDPEDLLIIRHLSDRRKIRHELVHIHFSVHNVTSEGIWNFKFCVFRENASVCAAVQPFGQSRGPLLRAARICRYSL